MPREDFGIVADLILQAVKSSSENDVVSPEGVEEFLDEAAIFDLEAKTEDRTDFSIAFWHPKAPLRGFNVRSRLGVMNPLLDGGRAANLKLEQSGVKMQWRNRYDLLFLLPNRKWQLHLKTLLLLPERLPSE